MAVPNPYAPPIADDAEPILGNEHEATRRRLIGIETNIRSLGSLVVLGGVFSVPMGLSVVRATTVQGIITLLTAPLAMYAGMALRKLDVVGRTLYTVIAVLATVRVGWNVYALSSVATPPGVVQGMLVQLVVLGLFLAMLWGSKAKEVFTEHYSRVVIPATPYVKYKTSRAVIAVLVILVSIFVALVVAALAS